MVLPQFTAFKHIQEQLPFIPEIIGYPPHIGIFFIMPGLFDEGRSRGKAQHNRPAAFFNGLMKHFDFVGRGIRIFFIQVSVADIIAFDIIHTPLCIKGKEGIVVSLTAFFLPAQAVHVRIPAADRGRISNLIRRLAASQHRKMLLRRRPGNPPHNMNAEFQPQAVYVIRQRPEARSTRCRGKTLRTGEQSSVFVHFQFAERNILVLIPHASRTVRIPLDIHHHIFPAKLLQMGGHIIRISLHLFLIYRGIIIIIAVPAHGRCLGKFVFIHVRASIIVFF